MGRAGYVALKGGGEMFQNMNLNTRRDN